MDLAYQAKRLVDVARGLRAARALAQQERWPRERLERHQQERLDALVRYAVENSPFYRERLAGLPRTGPVELGALPTLDKRTMMTSPATTRPSRSTRCSSPCRRRIATCASSRWFRRASGCGCEWPAGGRRGRGGPRAAPRAGGRAAGRARRALPEVDVETCAGLERPTAGKVQLVVADRS